MTDKDAPGRPSPRRSPGRGNHAGAAWALYAIAAAGVLLRLVILLSSEHRLDSDESVVGMMAIDILEGRALPMFFYGTQYNGGGAMEAYLAAAAFALFGPSEIAIKPLPSCSMGSRRAVPVQPLPQGFPVRDGDPDHDLLLHRDALLSRSGVSRHEAVSRKPSSFRSSCSGSPSLPARGTTV